MPSSKTSYSYKSSKFLLSMIRCGTLDAYQEWIPPPPIDMLRRVDCSAIIILLALLLLSISLSIEFCLQKFQVNRLRTSITSISSSLFLTNNPYSLRALQRYWRLSLASYLFKDDTGLSIAVLKKYARNSPRILGDSFY